MTVIPFRKPEPKPIAAPVRLVPLSRPLLDLAISLERDGLMAEMAFGENFAAHALLPMQGMAAIAGGNFVACGGLICHWLGRAEAWALTSTTATPRELTQAVRLARGWLDLRQRNPIFRRIECYVRDAAPWRVSFMHALDFEPEGCCRGWGPDGTDFDIYSRVR